MVAGLLLLTTGAGTAIVLRESSPPRRPDVVLVIWDTCRADRLSLYGYPLPTTPFLREFARDAVRYTRCYSPAPWTPPAHGSLFTGLMPSRHGLTMEAPEDTIREDVPTLAETLRAAGYETVCVTANSHVSPVTGLARGFGEFHGLYEDGAKPGAALVREAVEGVLARRREREGPRRPLFLFLNMMDAHAPLEPPPAVLARMRPPDLPLASVQGALATLDQKALMAHLLGISPVDGVRMRGLSTGYDAAVAWMDEQTSLIFDSLREEDVLDGALVAVTSDHGEHLGDHGLLEHRHSVYDGLLHVPLIVRMPGRFEGGRVEEAVVSLMDLYPTILDAAKIPVPPKAGGDAMRLQDAVPGRRILLAEHGPHIPFLPNIRSSFPGVPEGVFEPMRRRWASVRERGPRGHWWKYIRIQRADDGGNLSLFREELYDLSTDPGEDRDLLGGNPPPEIRARADRMRELFPRRKRTPER